MEATAAVMKEDPGRGIMEKGMANLNATGADIIEIRTMEGINGLIHVNICST